MSDELRRSGLDEKLSRPKVTPICMWYYLARYKKAEDEYATGEAWGTIKTHCTGEELIHKLITSVKATVGDDIDKIRFINIVKLS